MGDIGVGIRSSIKIFVDDSKICRAIRDEEDVEQVDLGEAAIADVSDSDDEITGSIIVS